MIHIRLFLAWLTGHFDIRFIFTPFAAKNIVPPAIDNNSFVGYTDLFIFGIRVARIQQTKSWQNIK